MNIRHDIDPGTADEKITAVPLGDPAYTGVDDIGSLPRHIFDEIEHFFAMYKQLEGRETSVTPVKNMADAEAIISRAMANYRKKFLNE